MTTIVKLKGVDLSGKGLPSLYPFVDQANMEHAFDFRNRPSRFLDLTGKRILTGFQNDPVAGISNVPDPAFSFTTVADGGLGVNLINGNFKINKNAAPIPTDGSVQFSILIVGGLCDIAKYDSTKQSGGELLNLGAGGSVFGFGMGVVRNSVSNGNPLGAPGEVGSRHQSYGLKMKSTGRLTQKHFQILTFNGLSWTLHNKTLRKVITKTNAELAHSSPINYSNSTLYLGSSQSQDYYSDHISLYQHGWWPRVLTQAEIDEQYFRSLLAFSVVGI